MGGNALKNVETRRYGADEYFQLDHEVFGKLRFIFPNSETHTIEAYRAKESFGDLDILIMSDHLPSDWVQEVINEFNPAEFVKNGNVLSFEYKKFQIDLIATPSSEFETSKKYFAYNDLGNLLGRIAHSMGLKLGHDGLSYIWNVGTHQYAKEVISRDWGVICNVLGVDYQRYMQGFDELKDIFEFVKASQFFHQDIYLLENRNNASRVRDRKRKTYTEFLIDIEGHDPTKDQIRNKVFRGIHSKEAWLPYLFASIPGFEDTYNKVEAEYQLELEFRSRYNGAVVSEITRLKNSDLGNFMKWMKETHDQPRMKKDIIKFNPEVVPRWIEFWYGRYLDGL